VTAGVPPPDLPLAAPAAKNAPPTVVKRTPDTYWLLEGATLLLLNALGGLYVQGEENVPVAGPVLMVSNHLSYLDPVSIGDASPRRVVFMAKAPLFENRILGFLLRGVDAFPVRRGEPDRSAFRTTLAMLGEGRTVCIFPEGTRSPDGTLQDAEPGAALFAMKAGCPIVPVFVSGTDKMLARGGRFHRARVTVAFGTPFTLSRATAKEEGSRRMMDAIAGTRDTFAGKPSRRIYPHWIKKPREGCRAATA
jgi:1-acyl-sn-glycerol-3-phosphate acyltransferase